MDTYPQFELSVRPMPYFERLDSVEECQSHAADFPRMQLSIPLWQTRDHHVGVAYCLHLANDIAKHWNC